MDSHFDRTSTPTRNRWLAGARFALVFAVAFLLLRASWPWLERPYSYVAYVEIAYAVSALSGPIDVERIEMGNRRRLQALDFDLEIHPARPPGDRTRRSPADWSIFFNSRVVSFDPSVLLLALLLATPAGFRRRVCALLLAPVVLHVMLVVVLAAEVRYNVFLDGDRSMNILKYPVILALSYVGSHSQSHVLLPVLLWVAWFPDVVFGRRTLDRLRKRARPSARQGDEAGTSPVDPG